MARCLSNSGRTVVSLILNRGTDSGRNSDPESGLKINEGIALDLVLLRTRKELTPNSPSSEKIRANFDISHHHYDAWLSDTGWDQDLYLQVGYEISSRGTKMH